MKVALAQISPSLGDLENNVDRHIYFIRKAKKNKADLLVFPELSLTGYTLQDLVEETALNPHQSSLFDRLKTESQGLSLVFGFVEEKEKGIFYNSAAFLENGKILHIHRKVFPPTFGMFEEKKFFGEGKNFHSFPTPLGKAGMMICRDFLHYGASYLLFAGGAEIIIVLSAAPGRGFDSREGFASSEMWELMGQTISRFSTSFLFYCNRVGFEDGKSFAGGSFIYNPGGELLVKAPYAQENFLLREVNLQEIRRYRKKNPFKREDKPSLILQQLQRITNAKEV
ncbi:nitrilase [bacterium]|nr:nitrilase [bacterium]